MNLEITNDTFGSYLSFPDKDAGEIFGKTYLNVTCQAKTSHGERSHSIRLGKTLIYCKTVSTRLCSELSFFLSTYPANLHIFLMLVTNFICGSDYAKSKIVVHPEPAQVLEGDTTLFKCTIFSIHGK